MPSTHSGSIRITLQATGENTNTWGSIGNTGGWELVDDALAGITTSSTATLTLTTVNGAADQARKAILNYTGATAGVWTIPSVSKVYQVRTATAQLTLTNGSNSLVLVAGDLATVATDGTAIWKVQSADFAARKLTNLGAPTSNLDAATKKYVDDTAFSSTTTLPGQTGNAGKFVTTDGTNASWGMPATATAADFRANVADKFLDTDGVWASAAPVALTYAASLALDFSAFINGSVTLTGNVTFTFSNAKPGQSGMIRIVQDGTGGRVATWPAEFFFAANIDVLSTAASKVDYLFFTVFDASTVVCSLIKDPV